jgi:hypothetical protein
MMKAFIETDRMTFDSLLIFIVEEHPGDINRPAQRWVLHTDRTGVIQSTAVTENPSAIPPSMRLPEEAGRALLESLMRHFHGAEDTRALRQDYDAERTRVDTLLAALVQAQRVESERNAASVTGLSSQLVQYLLKHGHTPA